MSGMYVLFPIHQKQILFGWSKTLGPKHSFLFPIPLKGVGTTCFSSCCDKDSAFLFTASRLPEVNPP
jgi:hypothetical protein